MVVQLECKTIMEKNGFGNGIIIVGSSQAIWRGEIG